MTIQLLRLLYIELPNPFLIGEKRTVIIGARDAITADYTIIMSRSRVIMSILFWISQKPHPIIVNYQLSNAGDGSLVTRS